MSVWQVDKVVKECKHTVRVPCSEEAQISDCANPCTRYLNCGHLCAQKCQDQCSSKHCTQPKSFKTTYPMLCGHTNVLIPCKEASKVRNGKLIRLSIIILKLILRPCSPLLICQGFCLSFQQVLVLFRKDR